MLPYILYSRFKTINLLIELGNIAETKFYHNYCWYLTYERNNHFQQCNHPDGLNGGHNRFTPGKAEHHFYRKGKVDGRPA
jgi:hypothetical protein